MTDYTEAVQTIAGPADERPLQNEDTRLWLRENGFDLARHMSWWDQPNDEGAVSRHYRQSQPAVKPVEQWR
jgi:hypothetical protein